MNQLVSFIPASALAAPVWSNEILQRRMAFVCNLASETVSLIDLEHRALVGHLKLGKYPIFPLCLPQGKLIVALHNIDYNEKDALLDVIDLKTLGIHHIQYPSSSLPSGIVYNGKLNELFVADEAFCRIHVHDGKTFKELYSLPTGLAPAHLDISSNGKRLAVANRKSADLYLYDLERHPAHPTSIESVPLGPTPNNEWPNDRGLYCSPFDVKFSKDNNICYISDWRTGELLVIDVIKHIVTDRIPVGKNLFGMALDKASTTAYVCDYGSNSVYIVDLDSKRVDKIEGLEGVSSHCAVDEKGRQLVVTCQGGHSGGSIHIIDLETNGIVKTIIGDKIQGCMGVTIKE